MSVGIGAIVNGLSALFKFLNNLASMVRENQLRADGARRQREVDREESDKRLSEGQKAARDAANRARVDGVPDDAFRD